MRCLVAGIAGTCKVRKSASASNASILSMRLTRLDNCHAASTEIAGSYPITSIPRSKAKLAIIEPMAPRPTTPKVLPAISVTRQNASFSFSSQLPHLSRSHPYDPALGHRSCRHKISREPNSNPATIKFFYGVGVGARRIKDNDALLRCNLPVGMLLAPAPARATASQLLRGRASVLQFLAAQE